MQSYFGQLEDLFADAEDFIDIDYTELSEDEKLNLLAASENIPPVESWESEDLSRQQSFSMWWFPVVTIICLCLGIGISFSVFQFIESSRSTEQVSHYFGDRGTGRRSILV